MKNSLSLLQWLDHYPQTYLWLVGGLIVGALALTVVPLLRGRYDDTRGHDWGWGLLILAILAAGRWPSFFFTRELNPDESQLLAGAHTLTYDPVFWRSVNGGTAGPLDFFALWPAGWLCGWDTFLTARLTALGLMALSLILAHQCMALILGRRVARLAVLGAVCFEALTNAPDFLHYSTELVPVALFAVAAYAAARRWGASSGPLWSCWGGLALGAVPLGKLQAVPLATALGVCWLWNEIRTKGPDATQHRGYLSAGALLPAALFACQLTIAGEWPSFIQSYWRFNLHYAGGGSSALGRTLLELLDNSLWWDSLLHLWLPGNVLWVALLVRVRPAVDRSIRIFGWTALAATVISFGSVVGPGRPFLHYWQLLVLPLVFLIGAVTANFLSTAPEPRRKAERWLVAMATLGLVGLMLQHRVRHPNTLLGTLAGLRQHPRSILADRVLAHARPGESIAIWGWSNGIYVETGLRQATREAHVGTLIEPGPLQEYFRRRYLADLACAGPATFLDSVGPASLHYTSPVFAHDQVYPELAAVIRTNYILVEEFAGARIYRRRDLLTR